MDNDTVGAAERTLEQVSDLAAGRCRSLGLLTPSRNAAVQRLEKGWAADRPSTGRSSSVCDGAHALEDDHEEAHAEVNYGWAQAYSPEALAHRLSR